MEFNIYLLFRLCVVFYTQYNFMTVNALIGPHIRPAERLEFPYIVSLMHHSTETDDPIRNHICTATLISAVHVLSAAKCIENRLKNETVVVAGTTNLNFGRVYNILWWIDFNAWTQYVKSHSYFEDNDISITKLTQEVEGDAQPGSISYLSDRSLFASTVNLAGWGVANNHEISSYLLTAPVTIITPTECEHRIAMLEGVLIPIPINLLCTFGEPFALLQRGDFGGPLVYMNMIVGISKDTRPFIDNDFHPEKVNVHVSLEPYKYFIQDVTRPTFIWM